MLALLAYFRRAVGGAGRWRAGALFGLMYATKETWILAAVCMFAGARLRGEADAPVGQASCGRHRRLARGLRRGGRCFCSPLSLRIPAASSIPSSPTARTFARGAGVNTAHVHPWYFYFGLLLNSQAGR